MKLSSLWTLSPNWARRTAAIACILAAGAVNSHAQDVTLTGTASFTGTGTFNIKGNIVLDTSVTSKITVSGATKLVGTTAQQVGQNALPGASLEFDSLHSGSSTAKNMDAPVRVKGLFSLDSGQVIVNGKRLVVAGSTARTAGSLKADSSADTVAYVASSGTQSIIGATYSRLVLDSAGTKNLLDTAVYVTTLTHASGALDVNHKLIVEGSAAIGTVGNVSDSLVFHGAAANTIQTITDAASSGVIANAAGQLTIDSLVNNHGKIATVGAGALSFVKPAANAGVITDSGATGGLTFTAALTNNAGGRVAADSAQFNGAVQNNGTIVGVARSLTFNGTVTNADSIGLSGSAKADFKDLLTNSGKLAAKGSSTTIFNKNLGAAGTLLYDSTATATFQGSTDTIPAAQYGMLVLDGTKNKVADTLAVQANLALRKSLTMLNGHKILMTSTTPQNVSDTGEVLGTVRRNAAFQADTLYAFNRRNVGLGFKSAETQDIALTMADNTQPTNATAGSARYVKRSYAFSRSAGTSNMSKAMLYYTQPETVNVTNESKLGIRTYNAAGSPVWAKVVGAGYSRVDSVSADTNFVYVAGVDIAMNNVSELGLFNTSLVTKQNGASFASASTWDESRVPDSTDDVEINHDSVTVGGPAFAGTLQINAGHDLSVDNALKVGTTVDNFGTLHVKGSQTMTLAGMLTNNHDIIVDSTGTLSISGKLRQSGSIANNGTINVGQ